MDVRAAEKHVICRIRDICKEKQSSRLFFEQSLETKTAEWNTTTPAYC